MPFVFSINEPWQATLAINALIRWLEEIEPRFPVGIRALMRVRTLPAIRQSCTALNVFTCTVRHRQIQQLLRHSLEDPRNLAWLNQNYKLGLTDIDVATVACMRRFRHRRFIQRLVLQTSTHRSQDDDDSDLSDVATVSYGTCGRIAWVTTGMRELVAKEYKAQKSRPTKLIHARASSTPRVRPVRRKVARASSEPEPELY